MKYLYVVRHCKAEGQEPEAKLTALGEEQALILADYLESFNFTRIVSSPYRRAVQSIKPLAERLHLDIETDPNLIEADLGSSKTGYWLEHLRDTFTNYDFCLEGGESSRDATQRIQTVADRVLSQMIDENAALLVSHGRLTTLLLRHYNPEIGYDDWMNLTNPDVFKISLDRKIKPIVQNIWQGKLTAAPRTGPTYL